MKRDKALSDRHGTDVTRVAKVADKDRLDALFADEANVEVEATWGIYHRMGAVYRAPNRRRGRELMLKLIDSISAGVPEALT